MMMIIIKNCHISAGKIFLDFVCLNMMWFDWEVSFCSIDSGHIGCRELRSTKYISDGHCTSINPIKELVCTGQCLPAPILQNWIGGSYSRRSWGRRNGNSGQDWRCVTDKTRTQRIQLQCQDGSTRTYKITVVTSCKCKRYSRQHNESANKLVEPAVPPPQLLHKHKAKTKRRLGKKQLIENWHEPEPWMPPAGLIFLCRSCGLSL